MSWSTSFRTPTPPSARCWGALRAQRRRPHGSLMVVGDDDQAVFGWRGAAVENLLDFRRSFPCAARLVLSRNFRCRPAILEAATRCITHNTRRQPKALAADRAAGGELRVDAVSQRPR